MEKVGYGYGVVKFLECGVSCAASFAKREEGIPADTAPVSELVQDNPKSFP
jgi:hypothetical protein